MQFILRREKKHDIIFSPLQSEFAKKTLKELRIETDSIVFICNQKQFIKSGAALRICLELKGLWPLMIVFVIMPAFIRDFVYDFIAKKRVKWFGSSPYCKVISEVNKKRFIE